MSPESPPVGETMIWALPVVVTVDVAFPAVVALLPVDVPAVAPDIVDVALARDDELVTLKLVIAALPNMSAASTSTIPVEVEGTLIVAVKPPDGSDSTCSGDVVAGRPSK